MTTAFARLRRLPRARRGLLIEAAGMLAFAALAVALRPFARVAGSLRAPVEPRQAEAATIGEIGWAISACARRVPWRAKCLEQALAAQWMLRRRAIAATLHYGLARREQGLAAHAWVRAGAVSVVGGANADQFVEIARFPASA